jgi:AraC-like DNA-binding protein
MIYVTSGVIYVIEEDTDYEIRPGELVFLQKGRHHFGKKAIPRGTQWYFIHFYLDSEKEYPTFLPSPIPTKQYEPIQFSMVLPNYLSGLTGSKLEQSIKSFADYFNSNQPMREWNVNMYIFQLLTEISIYHNKITSTPTLSDKICEYLNVHVNEPFSSTVLEQHFFLSYKYMAAAFKKDKQLTMQQYHTKLRMNAASKLLKSTLLSVNEIGEHLGYSDQLYFSRCFHDYMGMSPTSYRKTQISLY